MAGGVSGLKLTVKSHTVFGNHPQTFCQREHRRLDINLYVGCRILGPFRNCQGRALFGFHGKRYDRRRCSARHTHRGFRYVSYLQRHPRYESAGKAAQTGNSFPQFRKAFSSLGFQRNRRFRAAAPRPRRPLPSKMRLEGSGITVGDDVRSPETAKAF